MPASERPTEEIVQDLQHQTDADTNFRILFDRYCHQVCRFFRRKGFSAEDAEELTQEVFISVYKSMGALREASQFEAWLFRIALNAFRNQLEHDHAKKREGAHVELTDEYAEDEARDIGIPSQARADPLQSLIDDERRTVIRAAVESLPEQMRRCIQFRLIQDLTNQEIASLMGISVNTVKAHLYQARRALAERLGSRLGEP